MDIINSKIIIKLCYLNKVATFFFNNKQKIGDLFKESYSIFHPKGGYKLLYKNKNLKPYFDVSFEKFFNGSKNIIIFVEENLRNNKLDAVNLFPKISSDTYYLPKMEINNNNNIFLYYCNDCSYEKINYYCRNCNKFICHKCKFDINSVHFYHKTLNLYENEIEECEKFYKKLLYNEIKLKKNQTNCNKIKLDNSNININFFQNVLNNKFKILIEKLKIIYNNKSMNEENIILDINNKKKEIIDMNINKNNNLNVIFKSINKLDQNLIKNNELNEKKIYNIEIINSNIDNNLKKLVNNIDNILEKNQVY